MSSGKVSHVPLRSSSSDNARTRSVHPLRASWSASSVLRSPTLLVLRSCAISACDVAGGRLVDVLVSDVGKGIVIAALSFPMLPGCLVVYLSGCLSLAARVGRERLADELAGP